KTVTADKFVGNVSSTAEDSRGIVRMNVDINSGLNDLLIVNSATGVNRLAIRSLTNSKLERSGALVQVKDPATAFELSIAEPDEIDSLGQKLVYAGAWSYALASEIKAGITKEWYLLKTGALSNIGRGIVNTTINPDTWYTEVYTLLNRMGIYRDGEYSGGFWFEAIANKQKTDGAFEKQHDQQFRNFTIGWDKMYAKDKGDLFLGIMGGYGKADRDISNIGDADFKSTHASLYSIYRTNNGFYATGLIKYNKYDNDMTMKGKENVTGEWSQNGYGASVQVGKRLDGQKGWYLEPQAQFSWMRINGESYTTNTGLQVDIDNLDSVRGRFGLIGGRSVILKDNSKLDFYGSLSLVHEFEGKTDVSIDDDKFSASDLSGTWGVVGTGFNWNFKPGQYLHGGVSYATGGKREQPWGAHLGLSIEVGGNGLSTKKQEVASVEDKIETKVATFAEPTTEEKAASEFVLQSKTF
ncbi:MAG: autotransporter outer membrane beta-barrel domain-containing protein, partial [Tissierellia bacterium]|nr:autotransporter outer membrane beta-barrel domain-containing protein [Tissierellia bacterium]